MPAWQRQHILLSALSAAAMVGLASLLRDTGSHFDPAVMAAFQPQARGLFDTLACDGGGEAHAEALLESGLRRYFFAG